MRGMVIYPALEPRHGLPPKTALSSCVDPPRASFYYFFIVSVVITHKTKPTAGRTLAFVVRIFVNYTIAIAVWTSFFAIAVWRSFHCVFCVPGTLMAEGIGPFPPITL